MNVLTNKKCLVFTCQQHHLIKILNVADLLRETGNEVIFATSQNGNVEFSGDFELPLLDRNIPYLFIHDYISNNTLGNIRREIDENQDFLKKLHDSAGASHYSFLVDAGFNNAIYELAENYVLMEALLEDVRPDFLLILHELNFWTKTIAYLAHKRKIPVITFQEGHYSDGDTSNKLTVRALTEYSDLLLAWGSRIKGNMEKALGGCNKIKVIGAPHTDDLYRSFVSFRREDYLAKIELVQNKTIYSLFMTDSMENPENIIVWFKNFLTYTSAQGIVKFRPATDFEMFRKCKERHEQLNVKIYYNDNPNDILFVSDYVITEDSTVGLEALMLKKPIFYVYSHLNLFNYDQVALATLKCNSNDLSEYDSVVEVINNYNAEEYWAKADKYVNERIYCFDGDASERAVQAIGELLMQKTPEFTQKAGCDADDRHRAFTPENTPRISVIIPCYNYAHYLPDVVKSVVEQTFQSFEIIIVNDGSTDNSIEIAEQLIRQYPQYHIKLINQPNSGHPAVSRNRGISEAQADLILPLDADDMLHPSFLQKMMDTLDHNNNVDIVYCDTVRFGEVNNTYQTEAWDLNKLAVVNVVNYCALYRKKVWTDIGGYKPECGYEDWEFWIAAAEKGFQGYRIPGYLFYYRSKATGRLVAELEKRDAEFKAQIVIKHPKLYDAKTNEWANNLLDEIKFGSPVVEKPITRGVAQKSILIVVHNFPPHHFAGVEIYTYQFAKMLTAKEHDVTVFYPVDDKKALQPRLLFELYEDIKVVCLVSNHDSLTLGNQIVNEATERLFRDYLTINKFGVIHFQHLMNMPFSFIDIATKYCRQVFLSLHDFWIICETIHLRNANTNSLCSGPESTVKCAECLLTYFGGGTIDDLNEFIDVRISVAKKNLSKVTSISAPTKYVAEKFKQYNFARSVTIAPLGMHLITRSERRLDPTHIVFGFLGVIHATKNIFMLAEVFKNVVGTAKLLIFGSGEPINVSRLGEIIRGEARIEYRGAYKPDQLPEILSSIDVLVLPSVSENYPLVIREALSAGVPVIASKVGGIPEIILHNKNGLLFDPSTPQNLFDCLQYVVNNPSIIEKLKQYITPILSISGDVDEWLAIYDKSQNEEKPAPQKEIASIESSEPRLKIAVFSLDFKIHACGYYRLFSPLSELHINIELSWAVGCDGKALFIVPEMEGVAETADIIIVQRLFPRKETSEYLDYLCSLGKLVVFEIDDLITELPPSNSSYEYGIMSTPYLYDFIPRCSAVTVSTPELKKYFSLYNNNIYVLPNLIDDKLWCKRSPKSSGPVVIGYAGTVTHNTDIAMLEETLERIALIHGDKVAFIFMGCQTDRIAKLPGFSFIKFDTTFEAYAKKLQETSIDIMLIPLEDNSFNRCKSNIKWLEYSSCGFAGIYADLPPYNNCVEHGSTGLLVGSDPQQWFNAINLLINNPELRHSIATHARQKVLAEYTLQSGAHRWLDVYREMLEKTAGPTKPVHIKFSIIVLTLNHGRMLEKCLASLYSNLSNLDDCEIIIGDNGSSDDTGVILAKYKIHKLIHRETNEGLELYKELYAAAEGDIIIEIDDDVIEFPLHFEREIERYLEAFPDYGLIGLDVAQDEHTNGAKPDGRYYGRDFKNGLEIERGPVVGCCMAIRKSIFNAIGGFSGETLSLTRSQDWVLADRVKQMGLHTGIMTGIRCLHACGPYYAARNGRLSLEVQKYQASGQSDRVEQYCSYSSEPVTGGNLSPVPVSVIIPLFNNMDYTRQCIEQLVRNTSSDLYELILIDNGCTDDTYTILGDLPDSVKVIRNINNQGFAKACNQGAQVACGKYLLFLNNDTEPQAGWLEPLLNTAEQDVGIAAVGGKLLFPDGTIQHAGVVIADDRAISDPLVGKHIYDALQADHPEANVSRAYQALTAACLLVRREAFEAVQGFDEGYWNGYEDVDLCFKFGQQGWRCVYQPDSVVIHHESKSGNERFARATQNIQRLHDKWLGTIRPDVIIYPDSRVEWLEAGASAATAAPLVSIIIPVFNQAQLTNACVEAIRSTAGDQREYELILVDNGSQDWTPEYLKSLGNSVTVISNTSNLGFAKACNQGAKAAKAKYLLFLNNDTLPQQGWLDALLSGIEKDGADIVGAKLLYPNGRVQHAGVAFSKNGVGYHIFKNFAADSPAVNKKRFMQCVTAACLLVSKRLFNELAGFDEQFRNGFEDVDFCLRAGQAGKRILYNPTAVVIHLEEQSEGRKQHDHENMQRYLTRWQGRVGVDDEAIYVAEGFSVEWYANGTCVIRPSNDNHEIAGGYNRYPLIPLVKHSYSSIVQKLSSSQKLKGVLNHYTTED